jgi:hypothetical protein
MNGANFCGINQTDMNPNAELILLRDFYAKWIAYHQLGPAPFKLKARTLAGAALFQAHKAIQTLHNPPLRMRANG